MNPIRSTFAAGLAVVATVAVSCAQTQTRDTGKVAPPKLSERIMPNPQKVEFRLPMDRLRWVGQRGSPGTRAFAENAVVEVWRGGRSVLAIECTSLAADEVNGDIVCISALPRRSPEPFPRVVEYVESVLEQCSVLDEGPARSDLAHWRTIGERSPRRFAHVYTTGAVLPGEMSVDVRIWAVVDKGWVCSFNLAKPQ